MAYSQEKKFYGDFEYFIENNEATLSDYKGKDSIVEIPDKISEYPVTHIGYKAFLNCGLTSVVIPKSVTHIENESFMNNKLVKLTIPNSVIHIGNAAFNQNRINEINGEPSDGIIYGRRENGKIDSAKIVSYGGVAKVIDFIPNSVKYIQNCAFAYNDLTSIIIPNSVTIIGHEAFLETTLTDMTLPLPQREGEKFGCWYDTQGYRHEANSITVRPEIGYVANFEMRGKILSIIDGNTFIFQYELGDLFTIRMLGIDAPEISQRYGMDAKTFLNQYKGHYCKVSTHGKDENKSTLGILYIKDKDINQEMIRTGNARYDTENIECPAYAKAEDSAKAEKLGLWRKN